MTRPLRALIVEDSEDDALLLLRELHQGGYEVAYERVETADAMAEALGNREWDIIISDFTMPRFSAPEALRIAQKSGLDLPFIVVSGTVGEDVAVEVMRAGAQDYFLKSNVRRLIPAVARELGDAETRRRRKRAEAELLESERRFKRLVESVTNYIYSVEIMDGEQVLTQHSPGCVSVTGFNLEEFETNPGLWSRIVYEGDRDAVQKQSKRALSGESVPPLEHRIVRKDGTIGWVTNALVPRRDEKGLVTGYDGLIADITLQKKLEGQLLHAQKMEAMGQFAGGIAHDFNNILSAIMGFGDLMEMNLLEDDPSRVYLREILSAANKASYLTQSLLAFSRKQIIDPKPHDLNKIIQGVEKLLRRVIGEDIDLKTDLFPRTLPVMADRGQVEQILMNLATNARDAMPKGGMLILETMAIHIDEEYIANRGYGEPGPYALVVVTDSGAGMDEETRERVFEPFFTTKEVGRGTGLGLATVYGIVKQHNGHVNVYSEQGKGTTFRVYLPIMEGEDEEATAPSTALSPKGGIETVLLAEDDTAIRTAIHEVLKKFGYTVIEAENGEEAVKKYKENQGEIKLLLFDLVMPKKSGKEAYEEIKRIRPGVKALFLSGYTANHMQEKGFLDDALGFIPKPFSPKELLLKMREVLDAS